MDAKLMCMSRTKPWKKKNMFARWNTSDAESDDGHEYQKITEWYAEVVSRSI